VGSGWWRVGDDTMKSLRGRCVSDRGVRSEWVGVGGTGDDTMMM